MKKVIILLLILAISSTLLLSCDTDSTESDKSASKAENSGTASTDVSEDDNNLDHLKNYNFDGAEIVILVEGDQLTRYKSVEILPNESSPDIIKTAIEKRNSMVEETYGVKIVEIRSESQSDTIDKIRNAATTGDYDLVMPYMPAAGTLAAEGQFVDLYKYSDIIKLENTYWDQRANENLRIGEKLFFTTGDFSLLTFDCTHAIVFNKTLVEQTADVENPYDLLKDDKWTIEALQRNAKLVTKEVNGDGVLDYNDAVGFYVNLNYATTLYIGAGLQLTTKDENDYPTMDLRNSRAYNVIDRIIDLFHDTQSTLRIEQLSGYGTAHTDVWSAATAAFASNRVLFRSIAIADLDELSDYDVKYGILPTPKFDEAQDEYYNIVSAVYASCFAIPKTLTDERIERAAVIAEAIAGTSTDTIRVEYYDNLLKNRRMEDTEGEDALDLIFNNRVYEAGAIYDWGTGNDSLKAFVYSIVDSGTNNYESKLQSVENTIQLAIDETVNSFKAQK